MKHHIQQLPANLTITCCLMAALLVTVSCRKEKAAEPSNLDLNYFVVQDNPNDPADHAIYNFYKNTGIATFYNDTIYKKKISKENEMPERYTYIKLTFNYSPLNSGDASLFFSFPLTSRNNIPGVMKLLEDEIVPKIPSPAMIPSILLLDSFANYFVLHNWTSIYGFNTVGIKIADVAAMNSEERKTYIATLLSGIAIKRITDLNSAVLQRDFFSVSRDVTKNLPYDLYIGLPWMAFYPETEPIPQDIGILSFPQFDAGGMYLSNSPREEDDLRAYLTDLFYYTSQEFADLHTNETLVLKKMSIIRKLTKEAGFKIPD